MHVCASYNYIASKRQIPQNVIIQSLHRMRAHLTKVTTTNTTQPILDSILHAVRIFFPQENNNSEFPARISPFKLRLKYALATQIK